MKLYDKFVLKIFTIEILSSRSQTMQIYGENSIKRYLQLINLKIILQAAPCLFISMVGLFFTGYLFDISVKDDKYKYFPIILESTCILTFKGNIELNFAMYISSWFTDSQNTNDDFCFIIENSSHLISQSFVVGFIVTIIAIINSCLNSKIETLLFMRIGISIITTCIISSFLFIIFLLVTLQITTLIGLETENIILPILSTINDFFIVQGILIATRFLLDFSFQELLFAGFILILIFVISLFIILNSSLRLPSQNFKTLSTSCSLSVLSGYLLETFSEKHKYLASSFPVFSGMCGAICYIEIHRKLKNFPTSNFKSENTKFTLMFISLIISLSYIGISYISDLKYSFAFSILFVLIFSLQIYFILYIMNDLVGYLHHINAENLDMNILPIITSISDVASAISLISIALGISKLDLGFK